ncbi:hypothetical protein [Flavobacterium sp.]|uniref:hypothetical protein n=1 Tax=Flavobacterium sp. TaxID=239 RepID=UPI002C2BFE5A|nr:hypothetical protein [Flavobacterium sp.]HSD07106.1 hypothetical protein [Flavobacterium sp.]
MTSKMPTQKDYNDWKNNPNNWKCLGFFYFNKEDKRILVDKKNEVMGTTLNFANPKSILVLLAAFAFFAMVLFFIFSSK